MSILTDLEKLLAAHPDDPRAVIPLPRPQVERIAALLVALGDALGDELLRCPTWPQAPAVTLSPCHPVTLSGSPPPHNGNSSTARSSTGRRFPELNDDALRDRTVAALRALSAAGVGPTQAVWDAHQAALPAAERLPTGNGICKRLGLPWRDLNALAGLTRTPAPVTVIAPEPEPEPPPPPSGRSGALNPNYRYAFDNDDLLARAAAALRLLAVNGVAPDQDAFETYVRNLPEPDRLPSKQAICKRLKLTWPELVGRAGLTLSPVAQQRVEQANAARLDKRATRIAPATVADDDPPPFLATAAQEAREAAAFEELRRNARTRPPVNEPRTLQGRLLQSTPLPDLHLPDGTVVRNRERQVIAIR